MQVVSVGVVVVGRENRVKQPGPMRHTNQSCVQVGRLGAKVRRRTGTNFSSRIVLLHNLDAFGISHETQDVDRETHVVLATRTSAHNRSTPQDREILHLGDAVTR